MQIGRKRNGTWERIGTPAISGYIKMNNSLEMNTVTVNISHIVQCQAGDEVGLFTTRIGDSNKAYKQVFHLKAKLKNVSL